MDIKNAILISFVGHCIVLTPFGNFGALFPSSKKANDIQITYYPVIKPAPAQEISETKNIKPPAAKRRPRVRAKKTSAPVQKKAPEAVPQKAVTAAKDIIEPASIPGTTLPNTPECVTYYQYIREEIRRWLEREYRSDYGEGDVVVSFGLAQNGKLAKLEVAEAYSTDIPILHRIAADSIRFAAPFKPFPSNLEQTQISFNLTIAFKKR